MRGRLAIAAVFVPLLVGLAAAPSGAERGASHSLRIDRTISLGGNPAWLAYGGGAVWVPNTHGTLTKLDPRSGRVVWSRKLTTPTGDPYTPSATFGAGSAWLVNDGGNEVVRVDPRSGHVLARRATEDTPARIVFPRGGAWIVNWGNGTLSKLELGTTTLRPPVQLSGLNGLGAVATKDGLWVVVNDDTSGELVHVDPRTGKTVGSTTVVSSPTKFPLWDVTFSAGSLWVTAPEQELVARLDPRNGRVLARIKVPTHAPIYGIAAGSGAVWTVSAEGLYRIDASTNAVEAAVRLPASGGSPYRFVAIGGGSVWVSDYSRGAVYQIRLS